MKTAHDYARYLMSLIHFSNTNVRAQTRDCAEAAFVQAMADARAQAYDHMRAITADMKAAADKRTAEVTAQVTQQVSDAEARIAQAKQTALDGLNACGGEDMGKWIHLLRNIEARAKVDGCHAVRIIGREGWIRMLTNYRPRRVVLEKDI